ncbi:uncharacterized protein LOC141908997 isoform X2 [Tubulanus polymorphus]
MRQYENKIDNLMTEMGTLRNEVELQKTLREVDKKDDLLEESRRILEEQEEKLGEYKDELEETERENLILRRSMERGLERVCDAEMNRAEQDRLTSEKEELMKKLVEVEIDGQAAAKQCAALKDAIRRLREEKRISPSDSALIAKQRELLMEKLADFESTNRNLRRLLREAHRKEAAGVRLIEQRDVLMRKLAETDDSNQRLRASSLDKEREMVELKAQLAAQRDENLAMASLQGSMESTRGHLQKQLRAKEADCNRLAVQVRGMESQLAQEKIEVDHLQELLGQAKEKAERDKEALKKATRVQKQRASRSEDAMEIMNSQLLEKETQLAEIQNHMDEFKARIEKLSREKNQTITDNAVLRNRISELEAMLEATDDRNKSQQDGLNMKLQHKSSEANTLRLENDRLKTELDSMKEDFKRQADELRQEGAVLQARYEQLSRSLDAANHDKQRHQLQSRRLADQINNLNSDVEKFVADSTRLKLERDQLKSELETSRSFSAAQIDALNKECAALKSKCENLKIDLEAAARGQEKERIESTCLTEQVDQLKSTVGKLRSENMDAINENQDLKHELKSEKELLKTRTEQYARDHADHEAKVDAIQTELDAAIRGMEACRLDNQQLTDNQAALTRENDNLKRDFEELRSRNCLLLGERDALQSSIGTIEDKLSQAELEVSTLKSSLRQYENLVEEYRVQVNKSRAESEEVIGKYEESQKEVARAQREGDIELEKVSQSAAVERSSPPPLRSRSPVWDSGYSLPPRPQSPVRDTTGGGWSSADSEMLRELMQKVDHLTKQLESLRDKWHISQDENRSLQTTLEMLERKLREADEQNRELVNALNKKEETMATNQHRLDEKSRENSCLTRQLENSLTDARRQAEQSREKASQKERQCHSRILDLEAQLSQTRGEISRIKREKEEAERRYNSRLYDLKDRLEQSHSTNRSMQNYVQFLKSSYANIFGDTTMAGSACGGATSPLRSSALN